MNNEVSKREFNNWLWDAMKTLRQRYDIQNEHDTISFQAAIDLAQAAWKEAAEQAARECLIVRDELSHYPHHYETCFRAETCAQAIREKLLCEQNRETE